jgi:hypothetical protein
MNMPGSHCDGVELLAAAPQLESYYVDTGSWRNRIPATTDRSGFGRLEALSYAVVWGAGEDGYTAAREERVAQHSGRRHAEVELMHERRPEPPGRLP